MQKSKETSEQRKEKIRARYKGVSKDELEFIPAKPVSRLNEDTSEKRVAAYCRVSTDDPNQTSSYELQRNHYEEYIKEHEGWIFVDVYADEGISGTSMQHRQGEGIISAHAVDVTDPATACPLFRMIMSGIFEIVIALVIAAVTGHMAWIGTIIGLITSTPMCMVWML